MFLLPSLCSFFFFHDPATTEIYTLSLHDALPTSAGSRPTRCCWGSILIRAAEMRFSSRRSRSSTRRDRKSTSELQSRQYLVCRLLLEKKKITKQHSQIITSQINRIRAHTYHSFTD